MKKIKKLLLVVGLLGCCAAWRAGAAPLDALLTANRQMSPGQGEFEVAYDVVNDTVDVVGVRDKKRDFSGTQVGDYHGAHIRAGLAVAPYLWVDGAYWRRRLDYRLDTATLDTWQVGAQYRLIGEDRLQPALAIRTSAWGNSADRLGKSSPTSLQYVALDTVDVKSPKDIQYQLDLIGTWPLRKSTEISAFVGAGKSKVTVGRLSATTTRDGCRYNLAFGAQEVVGTLAQPCDTSTVDRFSIPNSVYGVDVYRETEYNAVYLQAGLSASWKCDDWRMRVGYQFQTIKRDHVDDIISSRGGRAIEKNHVLLGELTYRIRSQVSLFLRGQYMDNQFAGEIPFAYNTMTAHRFSERYGFASIGLAIDF